MPRERHRAFEVAVCVGFERCQVEVLDACLTLRPPPIAEIEGGLNAEPIYASNLCCQIQGVVELQADCGEIDAASESEPWIAAPQLESGLSGEKIGDLHRSPCRVGGRLGRHVGPDDEGVGVVEGKRERLQRYIGDAAGGMRGQGLVERGRPDISGDETYREVLRARAVKLGKVEAREKPDIPHDTDSRLPGGDNFGNATIRALEVCADCDTMEVEAMEEVVGYVQTGYGLGISDGIFLQAVSIVFGKGNVEKLGTRADAEMLEASGVDQPLHVCIRDEVIVGDAEFGALESRARGGVGLEKAVVSCDCGVGGSHSLHLPAKRNLKRGKSREAGVLWVAQTARVGEIVHEVRPAYGKAGGGEKSSRDNDEQQPFHRYVI